MNFISNITRINKVLLVSKLNLRYFASNVIEESSESKKKEISRVLNL